MTATAKAPRVEFAAADLAVRLDKHGRAYDAQKFLPCFDSAGRWINRNAGRKSPPATMSTPTDTPPATATSPAANAALASDAIQHAATPPPERKIDFSDIERAARKAPAAESAEAPAAAEGVEVVDEMTTAETLIGVLQIALMMIGDDEGILTDPEKQVLRRPLERVLKKYAIGEDALPVEAELAFAVASLVIARLKKPKTKTFFGKIKLWFAGKIAAREGQKIAQAAAS